MTHHVLHTIDSPIEFMLLITPLIESRFEIEQIAAGFIKPFPVRAGGVRISRSAVEICAHPIEKRAVLARVPAFGILKRKRQPGGGQRDENGLLKNAAHHDSPRIE